MRLRPLHRAVWQMACAFALVGVALPVPAAIIEATQASILQASDPAPPASGGAWEPVALPDMWAQSRPQLQPTASWYRVGFTYPPGSPREPWAAYLPYLYDGGEVWLNGVHAGSVMANNQQVQVRWARPHLLSLPNPLLHPGTNELMVRVAQPTRGASMYMPRVSIGPYQELAPVYDRRYFWVNTTPEITATVCLLAATFVLFIWWRRPSEVLYGLFGLAAALWGIRTLTFVVEAAPAPLWLLWRFVYLGATGGFIVMMALLALRLAELHKPWAERSLAAYWLLGPAWLLFGGADAEPLVNRYWIAGFVPIGVAILGISTWTVWHRRTFKSALLPAAMAIAVLAGVHDYVVNWNVGGPLSLLPGWSHHRIFLLHYAADLVLIAMGGLLSARFIQTLSELEQVNQTLESRVADRERELADNYQRMAVLQQEHAASQERHLIMRDLHDGLGSQLFTSLLRVERGDMPSAQVADALRGCIADMRLALDTLTPSNNDFRATLGDFMFRWQSQLEAAGVRPAWTIDVPDTALQVSPHAALQILRIAQEALTNVLKHAGARCVQVKLRQADGQLELQVRDDGAGTRAPQGPAGRGLRNMRARAGQLGGDLDVRSGPDGTCVQLRVPASAQAA
jgi:signal transduction histidine kinase